MSASRERRELVSLGVSRAVGWFWDLPHDRQLAAVAALFEHAIETEWVRVRRPGDVEQAMEDDREDGSLREESYYRAPYFDATGEPIDE